MIPRVLVASPPRAAVGGVAAHTGMVVAHDRRIHAFDQWWPLVRRSPSAPVRLLVHALGLARWVAALVLRRPDVVHLQVTSPGITRDLVYLRLAKALGRPVVAHLHTSGFATGGTSRADRAFRGIVDGADGVVVMSERVRDQVVDQIPGSAAKVHVVPNPAAVFDGADGTSHEGCRFLCVGEISTLKGQAAVVRAVDALVREGIPASLELVGARGLIPDEDWASIEASPNTTLTGVRRGAALGESYGRADVFVLFSQTEAEPMSMLESMAAGIPVVMTAVGSIPDTLRSAGGENPVVDPDDEQALHVAMRDLAVDPGLRGRIGARNERWAKENRSIARHVDNLRDVYRRVLAGEPSS